MQTPEDLYHVNAERYDRLSEPHESLETMNENIANFFRELGEIREKYKLPDVLVAVVANFKEAQVNGPAQVKAGVSVMQYGDSRMRAPLVLYLYRQQPKMIQALMRDITDPG